MLSSAITSVSGSSKVFTMGLVTYSNKSKNLLLKIPKKLLKIMVLSVVNAVHIWLIIYQKLLKPILPVSITGIAGPNGGTKSKPVGLVYIGIKNKIKLK